jgi:SAM-dependent methyltransferase
MKQLLKRAGAFPFRLMPSALRRRVIQLGLEASASGVPASGLRELLTIDEDLTGLINQLALRYDDGVHVKHRLMNYHDFFVERIERGERVLDVGCGYGAVAYSIADRAGAIVLGIDSDRENIAEARRRFQHPSLTFIEGTAPADVPSAPLDVVVASNVLEHIENRIGFLSTIQAKTAVPRWLIRVPMADRDWRVPLRKELGLFAFSDRTHFTEYTRASFEAEMRDAGFAVRHLQINWGEIWAEVGRDA